MLHHVLENKGVPSVVTPQGFTPRMLERACACRHAPECAETSAPPLPPSSYPFLLGRKEEQEEKKDSL